MTDEQIVALYWQRSERAIPETESRYGAYCRAIAHNILGSPEDAEECVNDTWLGAWNAMPEQRPAHLAPFLGRMTRWISLDRRRRQTRPKRFAGADLAIEELSECLPSDFDTQRLAENRELRRALDRFLGELKEDERSVFLARYWLCASVSQIAGRHGYSESKVKSMLHRTRLKLKKRLGEEGFV